ncbi:MAG: hypothetical protein JNG85_04055 [Spirochaetaceae bacterium]|nr:hypothetical protein [Spirochaetaceae bacterium]
MDKKVFERFSREGLIKSSDAPARDMEGESKVRLNRKGNELFNRGELETARRIFQTTGYSDGLIRVGNRYLEGGRPVDALKMFWLAREEARSGELIERAALAIQKLLSEEDENERPGEPGKLPQGSGQGGQGVTESRAG